MYVCVYTYMRWMDGWMDGRTDVWMDGRTDGRMKDGLCL